MRSIRANNQYTAGFHLNAGEVAVLDIYQFCMRRQRRTSTDQLVIVFAPVSDLERDNRIRARDDCCHRPWMHDGDFPVLDLVGKGARPSKRQTENRSQR